MCTRVVDVASHRNRQLSLRRQINTAKFGLGAIVGAGALGEGCPCVI